MSRITLSKLDVARRQLDTITRLFLSNQDLVSVHTLTSAAHQIVHDIAKKKDIKSFLIDEAAKYIKPEFIRQYKEQIRKSGNFFKHADRDDGEQLEFSLVETEFLIFDAIYLYGQIAGEYTAPMAAFNSWFYLNHPDLINVEHVPFKTVTDNILSSGIDVSDKSIFLDYISEIEKYKQKRLEKGFDIN